MKYSLYTIKGGIYDGRVVLENDITNYKIILATPKLKAKFGVSTLSYDEEAPTCSQKVVFTRTSFLEQKKLIHHLVKQLVPYIKEDIKKLLNKAELLNGKL